jgi:glycyl-tRNA synthetase (class II)
MRSARLALRCIAVLLPTLIKVHAYLIIAKGPVRGISQTFIFAALWLRTTTGLRQSLRIVKSTALFFPSSEIYDGLGAVYDYGQWGSELKKNIKDHWWKSMTQLQENIVGIDAAIFMHPTTWKASGHVDNFSDPMIDNRDSNKRYRVDHLIEAKADELEKAGHPEQSEFY